MRARRVVAVGGVVVWMFSGGAWLACSSGGGLGDTSSTTDGGRNDATSDRADSNPAADARGDGDAGFPDVNDAGDAVADGGPDSNDAADALPGVDCIDYCALMEQTCTGDAAQFAPLDAGGHAQCMNACYAMPVGNKSDTSGNTLGCRVYEGNLAQSTNMLDPHCWNAGPFGYGPCGDPCTDFCALTLAWCSPDAGYAGPPPYASLGDCDAACATYRQIDSFDGGSVYVDGGFVGSGSIGNTLDCREYFLESAMTSAAAREVHCPHTAYAQLADAAPGFPCTGP